MFKEDLKYNTKLILIASILQVNKTDEANVKMHICYIALHKNQMYCLSSADTGAGTTLGNILKLGTEIRIDTTY